MHYERFISTKNLQVARTCRSLRSDLTPHSASKRLTQWVVINKELHERMIRSGWAKGCRILSPLQVGIIVDFLGEP